LLKENGRIKSIPLYEGTTYPDGGVHTSVDELSRFFMAHTTTRYC